MNATKKIGEVDSKCIDSRANFHAAPRERGTRGGRRNLFLVRRADVSSASGDKGRSYRFVINPSVIPTRSELLSV